MVGPPDIVGIDASNPFTPSGLDSTVGSSGSPEGLFIPKQDNPWIVE